MNDLQVLRKAHNSILKGKQYYWTNQEKKGNYGSNNEESKCTLPSVQKQKSTIKQNIWFTIDVNENENINYVHYCMRNVQYALIARIDPQRNTRISRGSTIWFVCVEMLFFIFFLLNIMVSLCYYIQVWHTNVQEVDKMLKEASDKRECVWDVI